MVMFNCNRCSSALKKKDVITHSYKCGGKSNISLTCIDCLKDFSGATYDDHTSCVSEEVRYGGKGVVSKQTGVKQNKWLGIVRQVLKENKSIDRDVKGFLESIQHMENIPRNKKKFQNWAFSAKHIKDTKFLERVFDVLHTEFQKTNSPASETPEKKSKQNGLAPTTDGKTTSKNSSVTEEQSDEESHDLNTSNGRLNGDSEEPSELAQTENGVSETTAATDRPLSKKERKLLKKKSKFEAELKEVSEFQVTEIGEEEVEGKKLSKSKKRKLQKEDEELNSKCEARGSKKTKTADDNQVQAKEEVEEEEENASQIESPKKQKFNWHETILAILSNAKDNKIKIPKLAKKVIAEYVSLYGDKGIHDKLNAKLNKKLKTCRGIKVLKDKVSLVEGDQAEVEGEEE